MAKRYDQEELWELIRFAVGREQPALREAPMSLVVEDVPGQGPTVMGLIIAEPGDDIEGLAPGAPP